MNRGANLLGRVVPVEMVFDEPAPVSPLMLERALDEIQNVTPHASHPAPLERDVGAVTHGPPPVRALNEAKVHKHATQYERARQRGGHAAKVLKALEDAQAPVAISLPVLADSPDAAITNWTQVLGELFGFVTDPLEGTVEVDAHAVCVTGFLPDPGERTGGYFIFRNSWGTDWAVPAGRAPAGHDQSPERGYGCVSATHVDEHLLELCRLDLPSSRRAP